MKRARGGVEIEDVREGKGEAATNAHIARVSVEMTLHRGECVELSGVFSVDLRRRETIAGLRYGIQGMRTGGVRRLKVPPHLAYGPEGIPGFAGSPVIVPPNALLLCTVKLLGLSPSHPIKPKLKLARERKATKNAKGA
jgi:FKBP-type peptidyl-prolyl cis-trans isomerase FkpA